MMRRFRSPRGCVAIAATATAGAAFSTSPVLHIAFSSTFTSGSGGQSSGVGVSAKELSEDKLLEEEEFNFIRERMEEEVELLPAWRTAGNRFPNFQTELRRLRYVLRERQQFAVIASTGAHPLGLPPRPQPIFAALLRGVLEERRRRSDSSAAGEKKGAGHSVGHVSSGKEPSAESVSVSLLNAEFGGWTGTSFFPARLAALLPLRKSAESVLQKRREAEEKGGGAGGGGGAAATALTTINEDIEYLRRVRDLHALNYYFRMNLIPKRNMWHSLYYTAWNVYIACMNAAGSVAYGTLYGAAHYSSPREIFSTQNVAAVATFKSGSTDSDESASDKSDKQYRTSIAVNMTAPAKLVGATIGFLKGTHVAAYMLFYGLVLSPVLHLVSGLYNSVLGVVNFFRGDLFFDALSGRWTASALRYHNFDHSHRRGFNPSAARERDGGAQHQHYARRLYQREKRLIRSVGRSEFFRSKMTVETKWANRLSALGFSLDQFKESAQRQFREAAGGAKGSPQQGGAKSSKTAGAAAMNPYEVLQVRRTATPAQIKAQYKKLALLHHPDTHGDEAGGRNNEKFTEISQAYQILSNPEKRAAYDRAGSSGVEQFESVHGSFLSRTPEEMIQSIYGGRIFQRRLTGELHRSHWSLRHEAQVSVSVHDLEELQCIRTRQMAFELADMLDVHARSPMVPVTHTGAGGGGGGTAARRVSSSMSSLGTARKGKAGGAAAAAGKGRNPNVTADLKDSIMDELGERTRKQQQLRESAAAGGASAAAGEEARDSVYVLRPNTNPYNHFSKDFTDRVERLAKRCAEACFGRELLYDVGEAYVVSAQRYLGIQPFYAPKRLIYRKIAAGMGKLTRAFRMDPSDPDASKGSNKGGGGADGKAKASPTKRRLSPEEVGRRLALEYFDMEYDNIVGDLHICLRFACQLVCTDTSEIIPEELLAAEGGGGGGGVNGDTDPMAVLMRRRYALWYVGERFMHYGRPWVGADDSTELIAYIQQAAHSPASTQEPPPF